MGFFGIQACIQAVATAVKQPLDLFTPDKPLAKHSVALHDVGLELMLSHPHAGLVEQGAPGRWALSEVHFYRGDTVKGAWRHPLPYGLRWSMDAHATQAALDCEICKGRRAQSGAQFFRQSHFLPTAQVVQCTWQSTAGQGWHMRAIDVCHLGRAMPWDESDWIESSLKPEMRTRTESNAQAQAKSEPPQPIAPQVLQRPPIAITCTSRGIVPQTGLYEGRVAEHHPSASYFNTSPRRFVFKQADETMPSLGVVPVQDEVPVVWTWVRASW